MSRRRRAPKRCSRCGQSHPGWRHLWNCAFMKPEKVDKWAALLAEAGVPYNRYENLVPEWVAAIMHSKLTNEQRVHVLRTANTKPTVHAAICSIYELARDLPDYHHLILEAAA